MSGISLFGGGFFYNPFTTTGVWFATATSDAVVGVFGAWVQVIAAVPNYGRWLDLRADNATLATEYRVQYGIGAAGFEVAWQPALGSGIPGFPILLFGVPPNLTPVIWNFPISLPAGVRLAVRVSSAAPGANAIELWTSIWA